MAFIFLQSALPADVSEEESGVIVRAIVRVLGTDTDRTSFVVRKCAHFMEYLCLGVSLVWTVRDFSADHAGRKLREAGPAFIALLPWIIGTLYAVTDELHQAFVPGRSCELRDVIIDSCGVGVGVLIFKMRKRQNAGRKMQR